MSKTPFFSVVLPTLNRAQYLPLAIKSVLGQTFEDLELIVSNNCSSDNTDEIINSFADPRMIHLKPEKQLSMDEHWEFALSHAQGEYITFLGDDDAHSLIYLEMLKNAVDETKAEIISVKMADYHYVNQIKNSGNRCSEKLSTESFTNNLYTCDSKQFIEDLFVNEGLSQGRIRQKFLIPQLINTVYHHSVFEKVRSKLGKVFARVLSGDYYLAVITMSLIKKYCFIDSPLSFHGISPEGTTSSISEKEKEKNLRKIQPELAFFEKVPVNLFIPYSFSTDAILLAKEHLGHDLDFIDLDFTGYFVKIYRQMCAMEREGYNLETGFKEFFAALAKQDIDIQNRVNSILFNKKSIVRNKILTKFLSTELYLSLRDFRNSFTDKRLWIDGNKHNFSNIFECAQIADKKFLTKYGTSES